MEQYPRAARRGVPLMDRDPVTVSPARRAFRRGDTVVQAALVGAATLACVAAVGWAVGLFDFGRNGHAQERQGQPGGSQDPIVQLGLFKGWGKPDVAILLSGQQHGYLQPCGCSEPQYGGLTRRYNLMQLLSGRGWPLVAVDLGDLPAAKVENNKVQLINGPQTLLKYRYSLMALKEMNYAAVSFGQLEMSVPFFDAMCETCNHPTPKIICANLIRTGEGAIFMPGPKQPFQAGVFDSELVKAGPKGPAVAVIAIAGKELEGKVNDPQVKFDPNTPAVLTKQLIQAKKNGAELFVVLYQGSVGMAKICAAECAKARAKNPELPQVDVILCLGTDPLPPGLPEMVGNTAVINVGHKGQHVGVVGAYRTGNPQQPFKLSYQLVRLDPELATPRGKEKGHKLMELMEQYAQEVKDGNYLAQYKQVEHTVQVAIRDLGNKMKKMWEAEYAGSDACKNCHPHAYKVWQNSKHGKEAYKTLVTAKHPSNRQFDGECIVCHTTGFGYKTGFENEQKTAFLKDVGCESCHGPCSVHVDSPNNKDIHKIINEFKYVPAPRKTTQMDTFCQKCHDLDNDHNWNLQQRWKEVIHMTPQAAGGGAGPKLTHPD
jgi:hypothetical protein